MPRDGGNSQNGPIDDTPVIHGTSGSDKLQHTDKVAPMPEIEKGEGKHFSVRANGSRIAKLTTNPALPGMNASGGGVGVKGSDNAEEKKSESAK